MSNHVDDSCPEGPFVQTTKVHDDWYKPVPRVAESLDDLAVGMVVAIWHPDVDVRHLATVTEIGEREYVAVRLNATGEEPAYEFVAAVWHILADPPAPPAPDWLVPADTMEALREALDGVSTYELTGAARALLDAATKVER